MSTESSNSKRGPQTVRDEPGADLLGALVAAERTSASMVPPEGGERKTWERVVASVAIGGAPAVQPSSISGPASTAASLWIKIVLGVIVGGVFALGAYRLAKQPEPDAAVVAEARSSPGPRERPPSPQSRAPALELRAPSTPERPAAAATPESPPNPTPRGTVPVAKAPLTPAASRSNPRASDLSEETRLLARARAAVRSATPSDALAPLNEHARRFPEGQLTEDRMVLRARALCESGDIKAGTEQAAVLREGFPQSSHLPRVLRSCIP